MAATTSQTNNGLAAKKMKLEHENGTTTTAPSASSTTTPTSTGAPGYPVTTSQWPPTTQIPIDPALTQPAMQPQPATHVMSYSHYQPYATAAAAHYAQTPYGNHFHSYQPPPSQAAAALTPTTTTPTATTSAATAPTIAAPVSRQPTQTNEVDTTDIATLNDALGSAGVDLRAEEETLQRSQDHHTMFRNYEDRSRKQAPNLSFDSSIIGNAMRSIGSQHKVTRVPDDCVTYVALALRTRLQGLIKSMIAAADHRVNSQHDRPAGLYEDGTPMWSVTVRRDTKKLLELLERIEREEEMKIRRERKEKQDAAASQTTQQTGQASASSSADAVTGSTPAPGGSDEAMEVTPAPPVKKAKKKKEGPGVTAKNMSEEVQKRMSNAVATRGLGLTKYAWLNAMNLTSSPPKPKTAAGLTKPSGDGTTSSPTTTKGSQDANANSTAASAAPAASTWAKPYVTAAAKAAAAVESEKRTVTMRDAMFVIERERGHGAGRGAARAWV